jgi:hypothetical protein
MRTIRAWEKDEKFQATLKPLGMNGNKGLWCYYRQTPLYKKYLENFGTPEKAVFVLNAYLNGAWIECGGWEKSYYAGHQETGSYEPILFHEPNLIPWGKKEKTLEKYRRAIQALQN